MKQPPNRLAEVIRQAVQKSESNSATLAGIAGIDPAVLHRFMKGERTITLDTADRLCRALNLELMEGEKHGSKAKR